MSKENALAALSVARTELTEIRPVIEEEVRVHRATRLQAYQAEVARQILRAYAAGATMNEIKKAYGTKDHRTVSAIIQAGATEIAALRDAMAADETSHIEQPNESWFTITESGQIEITWEGDTAMFTLHELDDGSSMLTTEDPRWDTTVTPAKENKAVAMFDGRDDDEVEQIKIIVKAANRA